MNGRAGARSVKLAVSSANISIANLNYGPATQALAQVVDVCLGSQVPRLRVRVHGLHACHACTAATRLMLNCMSPACIMQPFNLLVPKEVQPILESLLKMHPTGELGWLNRANHQRCDLSL